MRWYWVVACIVTVVVVAVLIAVNLGIEYTNTLRTLRAEEWPEDWFDKDLTSALSSFSTLEISCAVQEIHDGERTFYRYFYQMENAGDEDIYIFGPFLFVFRDHEFSRYRPLEPGQMLQSTWDSDGPPMAWYPDVELYRRQPAWWDFSPPDMWASVLIPVPSR